MSVCHEKRIYLIYVHDHDTRPKQPRSSRFNHNDPWLAPGINRGTATGINLARPAGRDRRSKTLQLEP